MIDYSRSVRDSLHALGERARQLRIVRALTQSELATRAGLGVATVHRFENSGKASLEIVFRIATALGAEAAFDSLFAAPPYASIDDALARPAALKRRRAPRRT